MSFYHYLAKNLPFGILGRNMPGKVREDGGSLVLTLGHFGPCKTETEVRLRFTGVETLDVDIEITSRTELNDLEICLSSYTVNRKWGSPYYYLCLQPANEDNGTFIQPEDTPFLAGWYHSAPRDNRTAMLTYDGRWPGDKYQINITGPYFRLPILVSRNPTTGMALVQMAEYDTCTRVGSLYSSDNNQIHLGFKRDGTAYSDSNLKADYSPTYFYLFGEDFKPGTKRRARFRMMLTRVEGDMSNVLGLYDDFVKDGK